MTGIIGAMKIEIEALNAQMENRQTKTVSGIEFTSGTLCGREVVTAVCGIGKVFAAMCAQTMILLYSPDRIINTGVAGSLSTKLNIGDIAVSDFVVEHDMDCRWSRRHQMRQGQNCLGRLLCQQRGEEEIYLRNFRRDSLRNGGRGDRSCVLCEQSSVLRYPRDIRRGGRLIAHGLFKIHRPCREEFGGGHDGTAQERKINDFFDFF